MRRIVVEVADRELEEALDEIGMVRRRLEPAGQPRPRIRVEKLAPAAGGTNDIVVHVCHSDIGDRDAATVARRLAEEIQKLGIELHVETTFMWEEDDV